MIRTLSAALLLGLAAALPAQAETKKEPRVERPSDIVCTYEQATGSHIKKRTCMTRSERKARTERDREALDRVQNRSMRGGGPPAN